MIFKDVQTPNLPRIYPVDCVADNDKKVELLKLFNYHWQDWRFRDVIKAEKRYSEDQKLFFSTPPKDRKTLMDVMKQQWSIKCSQGEEAVK